MEVYGDNCCTR